jgi:N-acetylglucosaminyldiphosphoundecaprenol N-acetyl-beta-D-mannosaminyltransferase
MLKQLSRIGQTGSERAAPSRPAAEEPVREDPASPVWIWGLPFTPFTFRQTVDEVERLIARGKPTYFVTANLHTTMLANQHAGFREAILGAAFTVADGMPLIWASRWRRAKLPERVAGSDLMPALCATAAARGYRLFFVGGSPGAAEEAVENLRGRYPGVQIVGIEVPPFRALTAEENAALIARIRAARPDLLIAAFSQPKGELWLKENCAALGVPVCMQAGATIDFVAGRVARSPRWLQRLGLEWAYRLYREPRRLFFRYARNAAFLMHMLARDAGAFLRRIGCRIGQFLSWTRKAPEGSVAAGPLPRG